MEKEKVMTDQQKISSLCSILDEVFSNFNSLEPPGLSPGIFLQCILGYKHFDRLKTRYAEIRKGEDMIDRIKVGNIFVSQNYHVRVQIVEVIQSLVFYVWSSGLRQKKKWNTKKGFKDLYRNYMVKS